MTTYFRLNRTTAFESDGVIVVDLQTVNEYGTEDEVQDAYAELSLPDFAEQYRGRLKPDERLVLVSKIALICDGLGNKTEVSREDLKVFAVR
jgi:hypothetical protein